MSHVQVLNQDYLAIVSDWSAETYGGWVGNAYPILNLMTNQVVDDPETEFPNPGAVFVTKLGNLQACDFVVLRPAINQNRTNSGYRSCDYIASPQRPPQLLENSAYANKVAAVLDHPAFDVKSASRQLTSPRQNVTKVFFVRSGSAIYGPLIAVDTHFSRNDEVEQIVWKPASAEGVIYEWTKAELQQAGLKFTEYVHPQASQHPVIRAPLTLVLGDLRGLTSARPHDALHGPELIEWYLKRCPSVELPKQQLQALRSSFLGQSGESLEIQAARLKKIENELASNQAFLEHRTQFAQQYLESDQGRPLLLEVARQQAPKKIADLQAEVDKLEAELVAKRDDLENELERVRATHQDQLAAFEGEREKRKADVAMLEAAQRQLKDGLASDVRELATKMNEHIPLLAALGAARLEGGPFATLESVVPQAAPTREVRFEPVPASAPLRPLEGEAQLVGDLHAALASRGLHFSRDFVANIYTCFKAEALNLIIGPPGYGKSSLVSAVAECLGHREALLKIAVRRSWSEDRYLLGFYDSFHGRYDPGATGLVTRLIQAEADWKRAGEGLYLVLLDEFNLAAPEYYFSQLLQTLPSDEPARDLKLYDGGAAPVTDIYPDRLTIHPNVRFWGTINYDETTERLSPRTLDRTGMIFLGNSDLRSDTGAQPTSISGVGARDLVSRFVRTADDCPEDRWDILWPVIDFLRSRDASLGPSVEISPRVKKGLKRYLGNSVDVLPPHVAADFAVQQRILPIIRGRGEDFRSRVERLHRILVDARLPRSASHVEEALRRAEQNFGDLDLLGY